MAKADDNPDIWRSEFLTASPLLEPLEGVAAWAGSADAWPQLSDFNHQFEMIDLPVRAVTQDGKPDRFEDHYEPRIYLRGELQTRLHNWHDFFNALVWMRFPKTKAVLNRLHYQSAVDRPLGTNRSPLENVLTRFDECGAVLISDRADLLDHVREHRWTELFWNERAAFAGSLRCVVFGHATFEKALSPYLGMTTTTLLLHDSSLLAADYPALDQALAAVWTDADHLRGPDLCPFPVLGVPGWFPGNDERCFYSNKNYFRPKRI